MDRCLERGDDRTRCDLGFERIATRILPHEDTSQRDLQGTPIRTRCSEQRYVA